ncbi:hypothetical protein SAMN04487884_10723 [Butyrivibrio fibrisolvens]|uniref:Acyltransferase 3 domain-containing protein n=1 Tax=Butyrivibrio fibrisolvens TaxID=831 RepID=A0A1H9Q4H9_BUTFI|nr:hypothetical protein [Butyrivibrio fibrisolvens]SER54839.1 hypothetical protein SAMN04487884_10723 [Butyrivibrio fibrisolvens]
MGKDFVISLSFQLLLIILILFSIRKKNQDDGSIYSFWDADETNNIRGFFAVLIVLFHVPVSSIYYNLLGCTTFVFIVTCFSMFASYGIAYKTDKTNGDYKKNIPFRMFRIVIALIIVIIIKLLCGGSLYSGGMNWIYNLLFYYLVSFLLYSFLPLRFANVLLVVFSILYSVMGHFMTLPGGWYEQSLGFGYGIILYYIVKKEYAINKFVNSILVIICVFAILISGQLYIYVHDVSAVSHSMFVLRIIMTISEIVIFFIVSNYIILNNRVFEELGKLSLFIYLIHGLAIDILSKYFKDGILIIFVEIASVIAAILLRKLFFYIEKLVKYYRIV